MPSVFPPGTVVHHHWAPDPWTLLKTRCGGAGESTGAWALVTCEVCLRAAPRPLRIEPPPVYFDLADFVRRRARR